MSAASEARRRALTRACRARLSEWLSLAETHAIRAKPVRWIGPSRGNVFAVKEHTPEALPLNSDALAERLASEIEAVLDAYALRVDESGAMAVRLAAEWPLFDLAVKEDEHAKHFAAMVCLEQAVVDAGIRRPTMSWPSNVSLDDVRDMIERSRDPRAQVIATSMREGLWVVERDGKWDGAPRGSMRLHSKAMRFCRWADVFPYGVRCRQGDEKHEDLPPAVPEAEADFAIVEDATLREAFASPFHPSVAALVAWSFKTVREGLASSRAFHLPSSRESRIAFDMLARQKALCADDRVEHIQPVQRGGVRLIWDGASRGWEQLRFSFVARDITMRVALGIKDQLGPEGLRDYLILHRMAASQGRTGEFVWTWEKHRANSAHARRVRSSQTSDEDARAECIDRIVQLSKAELHVEVESAGRREWRVVGDDPLVFIGGGTEESGRIEGLKLRLNRQLYASASHGAEKPHYTMIPEAVLDLPAHALCLATLLVFLWRAARDEDGVIELEEETVLKFMDTSIARSRHHSRAKSKVKATLDAVVQAMGSGCRWEPADGAKVRIVPPSWWVDHVVLSAPLVNQRTPHELPRTGGDLRRWREAHGLTQGAAAVALGVSPRTIGIAEANPDKPLSRAFKTVQSWARPRELPSG